MSNKKILISFNFCQYIYNFNYFNFCQYIVKPSYIKDMKKHLVMIMAAAMLLTSCGSVPITGRKQLNLVSDSEVLQSSLQSYTSFMSTATVSTQKTQSEQVTRVGKKIAAATESYLKANGMESEVKNFAWEFNLVKSDEVNAWCMPGGKIVVYEGIMKLVSSDAELAVVLGHEVAHAVAKHSNERMSQQMLAQYGAQAVSVLTSGKSSATQAIAQQVYGLGANYGVMQVLLIHYSNYLQHLMKVICFRLL